MLSVAMLNREILLRDERVAGAGFVFETLAIERLNSAAHGLDQSHVLQLINSLRDGGAARTEQMGEHVLSDA